MLTTQKKYLFLFPVFLEDEIEIKVKQNKLNRHYIYHNNFAKTVTSINNTIHNSFSFQL